MTDLALRDRATELHVVFRLADSEYTLPAATVLQMESFTGATPVPGTAPYVLGILQVRGRIVPVMDLRARFGLAVAAPTGDSRVVVGEHGDRTVALLVDSAREVIQLSAEQLRPPPRLLSEGMDGFVKAVAQLGPRLLMVLDFPRVIGEEPLDVRT